MSTGVVSDKPFSTTKPGGYMSMSEWDNYATLLRQHLVFNQETLSPKDTVAIKVEVYKVDLVIQQMKSKHGLE